MRSVTIWIIDISLLIIIMAISSTIGVLDHLMAISKILVVIYGMAVGMVTIFTAQAIISIIERR